MNSREKILSKLFEDPQKKYYLRELARELKLNPSRVSKLLLELEKEKLINRIVKKHILEISTNFENKEFIEEKRVFNLQVFYHSKILDFLIREYNPKSISIYGSFSQGRDLRNSDIDIAIFSNVDRDNEIILESFEKKLKRKIHLLVIEKNKMTDEIYTNIINGIVVYGYLDKK